MTAPPNPPAFPFTANSWQLTPNEGMSLRDWFAGQALPEIMRRSFALSNNAPICGALMAEGAYDVADAMMAERAGTIDEETEA